MRPFVAVCFAVLIASALLTNVHSKAAKDLDVQESRK